MSSIYVHSLQWKLKNPRYVVSFRAKQEDLRQYRKWNDIIMKIIKWLHKV
jgi:hypothetical protein